MQTQREPLSTIARRFGLAEHYLHSYVATMKTLEELSNVPIMLGPINTLLDRMLALKQDVYSAAQGLEGEMVTEGGRAFVRAALVDIVLHRRKPGQRVVTVPSMRSTLAQA